MRNMFQSFTPEQFLFLNKLGSEKAFGHKHQFQADMVYRSSGDIRLLL